MKEPLISVLLCTYNDEKYIYRAVKSILDQTFEDFEFIIINDGSTDGSGDIFDTFTAGFVTPSARFVTPDDLSPPTICRPPSAPFVKTIW